MGLKGGFGTWVMVLLHPMCGMWGLSCPPGSRRGPQLPWEGPHGWDLLLLGMNKAQLRAQMHFADKRKIKKLIQDMGDTSWISDSEKDPCFLATPDGVICHQLFASHRFVHPKSKFAGSRGLPESR